jgi:hypothetical protein
VLFVPTGETEQAMRNLRKNGSPWQRSGGASWTRRRSGGAGWTQRRLYGPHWRHAVASLARLGESGGGLGSGGERGWSRAFAGQAGPRTSRDSFRAKAEGHNHGVGSSDCATGQDKEHSFVPGEKVTCSPRPFSLSSFVTPGEGDLRSSSSIEIQVVERASSLPWVASKVWGYREWRSQIFCSGVEEEACSRCHGAA